MKLIVKLFLFLFIILLSSCVDDIDFNQADDLKLTPAFSVSLMNFTVKQDQLVVGGVELDLPAQKSEFTFLNNSTARENLTKVEFDFEVLNEFNREFIIEFRFLDGNGNRTHEIRLNIPNGNLFFIKDEIIIADNRNFLNTKELEVKLTLLPSLDGSVIDATIPASLTFKSGGTFYFVKN